MEKKKKKANCYAEENVINVLKEAFAKVYADGYRDGYKDCKGEISVNLCDSEVEYVDLGLQSGTLWSNKFEMIDGKISYFTYGEASAYNLPTEEQVKELLETCKWKFTYINSQSRKYDCIGPNGNSISFLSYGYKEVNSKIACHETIRFWAKDTCNDLDKSSVYMYYDKCQIKEINKMFMGYRLPVRLVKSKQY